MKASEGTTQESTLQFCDNASLIPDLNQLKHEVPPACPIYSTVNKSCPWQAEGAIADNWTKGKCNSATTVGRHKIHTDDTPEESGIEEKIALQGTTGSLIHMATNIDSRRHSWHIETDVEFDKMGRKKIMYWVKEQDMKVTAREVNEMEISHMPDKRMWSNSLKHTQWIWVKSGELNGTSNKEKI